MTNATDIRGEAMQAVNKRLNGRHVTLAEREVLELLFLDGVAFGTAAMNAVGRETTKKLEGLNRGFQQRINGILERATVTK